MTMSTNYLPALNSGSLQAYLDSVQLIPVLSREEEVGLFERFQLHDDIDAARQLVISNLRYVNYIARSYAGYGLAMEDLIQQGNVGLMKSVKRFDLKYQVRLISFAVHWIRAEIHEFVLKNWRIVKVATTKAQRKLFFNLRKAKKHLGWFTKAEIKAIASDLNVKPQEVVEMESRLGGFDESFDMSEEQEESGHIGPALYLSEGEEENPALLIEHDENNALRLDGLQTALANLDERSRDIIQSRWLSEAKVGLKMLAEKYSVSLERIRQIESKALTKMQGYIEA